MIVAAVLFSTGGAAIKATTLTSWQTAGFRSVIAACMLLLLVKDARRGWTWKVFPVGLAYGLTLMLFVHANKLTTAANAIFLQATAPAYLLILGPLVLKEPIRRSDLFYTAGLAAGLILFFLGVEPPRTTALNPPLGNVYAALSGLTWALTLIGLRWNPTLANVAAGNIVTALLCVPIALPVALWTHADIALVLYMGCFQVGLGYVFLMRGIKQVPAFEAALLNLVEPVCNPIWVWLFHSERPGALSMLGAAVILGSTAGKVMLSRSEQPAASITSPQSRPETDRPAEHPPSKK